jgi:crotonobetainyl-CoA:carnitine CoA-transferase CaiB-like acyl-CoA transferase
VIYLSITGFGQIGPLYESGGYDFLVQGMSGLLSVTHLPDGEPRCRFGDYEDYPALFAADGEALSRSQDN